MFLKAAINGGRSRKDHPRVAIAAEEIARTARSVEAAGAHAIHFHPRDSRGEQSIDPDDVARTVRAVRDAGVKAPIGITTGLWCCDGDPDLRHDLVARWRDCPDFASVAFSEPGAARAAELVVQLGMALESAVWTMDDVPALLASSTLHTNVRVLIEPVESDPVGAVAAARSMAARIRSAGYAGPLLYHGEGDTTWPVLDASLADGHQARIGFEDDLRLPDGAVAASNDDLVSAALARRVGN